MKRLVPFILVGPVSAGLSREMNIKFKHMPVGDGCRGAEKQVTRHVRSSLVYM